MTQHLPVHMSPRFPSFSYHNPLYVLLKLVDRPNYNSDSWLVINMLHGQSEIKGKLYRTI